MGAHDDKMKHIIEASEIPNEEKVYLRKDFMGWRVVNPIRDPETNKMNYFNLFFGGKKNLFMLIFILVLFLIFFAGVKELIGNYQAIADNPCSFCADCQEHVREILSMKNTYSPSQINLSEFYGGDRGD